MNGVVPLLRPWRDQIEEPAAVVQNDTEPSRFEPASPMPDRIRRAAMVLTLMLGIPLSLAWLGFVGWSVLRLAFAVL
ncbi:hypothetical protein [Methylobacterium sp. WSM2598]|uniref:hypothetical protein n=1 Tax=Methylobacterium sp. WSM2598 TaxID=398261 RepID=UPI00039B71EA|nr:hypothetical protein [Methylobacterium sp. WSM2598]